MVDYKKFNKKIKLHSGSLPLMENTVETAAGCRYENRMDKRSGFWQIDLTKRAQELRAFIAPDGRVYTLRVMPFGIANAPAFFQELMNQVIALCKQRLAIQELLQRGAVLEAQIEDVILQTNTIDDHLLLLRQIYTVCQENHLCIKHGEKRISQDGNRLPRIPHQRWMVETAASEHEAPDGPRPNGFYIQS